MEETKLILGLDIGTNSVGWAVVSKQVNVGQPLKGEVLGDGVVIFPMGVIPDAQSKEESKNAATRRKRLMRRQYFRKKLRKEQLKKILKENNMIPNEVDAQSEEMKRFFSMPPYELRAKAVGGWNKEGEQATIPLNRMELGRILYHLAQRRGYKDSTEDPLEEDSSLLVIKKTDLNKETKRLGETDTEMGEHKTLGSYFHHLEQRQGEKPDSTPRIRNRYIIRQRYEEEFDLIWESQRQFHPELLTDELKSQIGDSKKGILFRKRPLQKGVVGKCSLEPKKPRCAASRPLFEEYRAYKFLNDVYFNGDERLTPEQMEYIYRRVFLGIGTKPSQKFDPSSPIKLKQAKVKFKEVKKALNELEGNTYKDKGNGKNTDFRKDYESYGYNFKDDYDLPIPTLCRNFIQIFGEQQWLQFDDREKDKLWHLRHNAKGDRSLLKRAFIDSYKPKTDRKGRALGRPYLIDITESQANAFVSIRLDRQYASRSRKALSLILPYLKAGLPESDAVVFAGIENAFGTQWDQLDIAQKQYIEDNVIEIMRNSHEKGGYTESIKSWLCSEFGLSERQLTKLYHHSQKTGNYLGHFPTRGVDDYKDKIVVTGDEYITEVRNPVVQAALFQVRKLVKDLMQEYGEFDVIRVELARELKAPKKERENREKKMRENEKINDAIKLRLSEYRDSSGRARSIPITPENILKLKLYDELNAITGVAQCPYTGNVIQIEDLFDPNGKIDIEHIIPYSISLNDSIANKTLCDAEFNRSVKKNKTPYQCFENDKIRWRETVARVKKMLPQHKVKRFIANENPDLDTFVSRQLNDTAYISRCARNLLEFVCKDVQVVNGEATAKLRGYWGLNNLLLPSLYKAEAMDEQGNPLPEGEYWALLETKPDDKFEYQVMNFVPVKKWDTELKVRKTLKNGKANTSDTDKENEIGNLQTEMEEPDKEILTEDGKICVKVVRGWVKKDKGNPDSKSVFQPAKDRGDHRHHAIDAVVIACTERAFLQKLATHEQDFLHLKKEATQQGESIPKPHFPIPFLGFRYDVAKTVKSILIAHVNKKRYIEMKSKKVKKFGTKQVEVINTKAVRGVLHDETYYGNIKDIEGNYVKERFRHRVDIDSITNKKGVEKIASTSIQKLITDRLEKEFHISTQTNYTIPVKEGFYFKYDEKTGRKIPQLFMQSKNGKRIPIYKVRIHENSKSMRRLYEQDESRNVWVKPGNNDHLLIYRTENGKLTGDVVSFWDAVKTFQAHKTAINPNPEKGELVLSLQKGDMVLLGISPDQLDPHNLPPHTELSKKLYQIRAISDKDYHFVLHTMANVDFSYDHPPFHIRIRSLDKLICTKIRITPTGKLELCPQV